VEGRTYEADIAAFAQCRNRSVKILHLLPSLERAGAEMLLLEIVTRRAGGVEHVIVCMKESDPDFMRHFVAAGVRVEELDWRHGRLRSILQLRELVRSHKPNVIQGWMVHANLLLSVLSASRAVALIWSVHGVQYQLTAGTRVLEHIGMVLSHFVPKRIVYPSAAARKFFESVGYSRRRSMVIPNGIDLDRFRPDSARRDAMRTSLDIGTDEFLVGCFARWHPDKDHRTLFQAFSRAASGKPWRLLCCGAGMTRENPDLVRLLAEARLDDRVLLLGNRPDMPELIRATDVVVCSSIAESFGNVIVEALACGLNVISTRCGGPEEIIGDQRFLVPVGDSQALALRLEAFALGEYSDVDPDSCRAKAAKFSADSMCRSYEDLYRSMIA
jgi:glycosyltransferase involved in cell wall biosynthesis